MTDTERIGKGKGMKLTTTLNRLRAAGACESRYAHLLRALGGTSFDHDAPINLLTILEHNGVDDFLWTLGSTACLEATAPALKVYQEATAPAKKAYQEATAQAKKAYKEAMAQAKKAYEEVMAPAKKAYQEATAQAKKAYQEVAAQAWKAILA